MRGLVLGSKLSGCSVVGGAVLVAALLGCLQGCGNGHATPAVTATATSHSTVTLCAEEDNVNISLLGRVLSFLIEATHPTYTVGQDNCAPDFTNCPPGDPGHSFTPGVYKLFDDGVTVVEAVREASWWQPRGMTARADNGPQQTDIHFVRVYRKIAGANEWPQFCVLYMDGNLRLIPHPPVGRSSVCFGSSVVVGPAPVESRPIAEIASVRYVSVSETLEVTYQAGGSAELHFEEVTRTRARVKVTIGYPTDAAPFATFRSMCVADGNADVDHVTSRDASDATHASGVMAFGGGEGTEWLLHRNTRSSHNTSAPDIRIKLLE